MMLDICLSLHSNTIISSLPRLNVTQTQMYSMYHTFNFLTGYTQVNPSVQSIEWRLIVLESVAGVPGFVAAGTRQAAS